LAVSRFTMSVLLILLPPRPRGAAAAAASADGAADAGMEWAWAHSGDGRGIGQQGRGGPATWPRADSLVLVLADADVAWHRVDLPKAPSGRLPQALHGILEESLLDDDTLLQFAVEPGATAGKPAWIAVAHRPWLERVLARAEQAGRPVDRLLPVAAPGTPPRGHFLPGPANEAGHLQLSWADPDGATVMPVAGSLAMARVQAVAGPIAWTAAPAASAAAEAWLGQPVTVLGEADRALISLANGWNLRQFTLAPRQRGVQWLRGAWGRLRSPEWRPVRWGLAALVVVQLIGLNAWAWHERRALQDRRDDMVALLRTAHPQVRAVLDAPQQMARETAALRRAAGQPGEGDLETLLAAAAAAWPEGQPPAPTLQFEPGRLVLGAPGWDAARLEALREPLEAAGWSVDYSAGKITLARAPGGRS